MAFQEVLTNFSFEFSKGKLTAIQKGVGQAVNGLQTMATRSDAIGQRMNNLFSTAKQIIGTYIGFRAIRLITSDYAQAADAIAKFSAGLGISTKEYQGLTHAAQLNGITVEELNVALPNLAKRAGDAADGSKAAATAFRRANVELKEAGKLKDPIRLLTDLADGLKTVEDEGRKTQILMTLFGRAGKRMGVLLDQGSEGIRKAMKEAEKLGIVLSKKQLKDAENYNDEMLRVKSIMIGIRNTIAGRVLPVLNKQLRAFQQWWREGNNAERALKTLKIVAIATGVVLAKMIAIKTVKSTQSFIRNILSAVKALRAFNLAALVTNIRIMLIVGAFALIGLAIEDLVGFVQGKDSIIGRLLGDSGQARAIRDTLVGIGQTIVKTWRDIKPELLAAWKDMKPALNELWQAAKPLIGPLFKVAVFALVAGFKGLAIMVKITAGSISALSMMIKQMTSSFKFILSPTIRFFGFIIKQLERVLELMGLVSGKERLDPGNLRDIQAQARQGVLRELDKPQVTVGPTGERIVTRFAKPVEELIQEREPAFLPPVRPATIFEPPMPAGGVGRLPSVTNNANVAPNAINLTVVTQAVDPREVAIQTTNIATERIAAVIVDASRNLTKPPRGQR